MARAVHIPVDPTKPIVEVNVPIGYPSLGNWLSAVNKPGGSGYIERVRTNEIVAIHKSCVMIVDEEGLYNLPVNIRASRLYPAPSPIYGDVLVFSEGRVDGDIDFMSLHNDVTLEDVIKAVS